MWEIEWTGRGGFEGEVSVERGDTDFRLSFQWFAIRGD